jgi:hypothetical protein
MRRKFTSLGLIFLSAAVSFADIVPLQFGSFTSAFDGWVNMNSASFSGISGGFPGSGNWTAPAGSNQIGSGDADLNKLSGSAFFATDSLYFGSFTQNQNVSGGTLRVRDQTPLPGVRTIVLQVQIGEAVGFDFHDPLGWPVLKLNGSNSSIGPSFTTELDNFQSGTFDSPATGSEPLHVNTYAFEWNLEAGAANSVAIDFSAVTHAQIYGIRLDQTTAVYEGSVFDSDPLDPPAEPPAAKPTLNLVEVGLPSYDADFQITTVTHGFRGDANSSYLIEYKEALDSPMWISAGLVSTGNGTFNVPFSASADKRQAWSKRMFFRATKQ